MMMEKVDKSWGREEIIVNDRDAGYCGKIMYAHGLHTCTTERHGTKDETFYVLKGEVILELFGDGPEPILEQAFHLEPGAAYRIRPGTWHRFGGVPGQVTVFVEFSTFHDDADTVKWEEPK